MDEYRVVPDEDEACVICARPIASGAGRYRMGDGAAHPHCYQADGNRFGSPPREAG